MSRYLYASWSCVLCLVPTACLLVDGGLPSDGSIPTSATNVSMPTTTPTTANGATEAELTSGSATMNVEQTSEASTMTGDGTAPGTTTGTTGTTTGPMTSGPVTSSSTTTGSTTEMTGTTGTTGMQKDPQPEDGLYADCTQKDCNMNLTDGCFELQDSMTMMKIDGYCTLFCSGDADCFPKPNAPAMPKCRDAGGGQKVCTLSCSGLLDCPTGMTCEDVNFNGVTEKVCW